jgi:hypothetical protein
MGGFRPVAPSVDGTRLDLVAFQPNPAPDGRGPINLGVFVLDRATLALVDRWAPAAAYYTMAVLPDRRSVALGGAPGMDPAGRPVPWEGSLTIHDADDGRVVAQFGRLGQDLPPILLVP